MTNSTRLTIFLGSCSLALAACSPAISEATTGPELVLWVPTDSAPEKCTAVSPLTLRNKLVLKKTFVDKFDTFDLGTKKWLPHYDGGYDAVNQQWLGYDWMVKRTLPGNKEQQLYVDPDYKGSGTVALGLNPFELKNGVLKITAKRTPTEMKDALFGYEFVSGLITTRASFVQRYGYFEMRAKIPAGKALWPAFWLLPADKSWPPELDILEVVGQQPDQMVTYTHWKDETGEHQQSGCRTVMANASESFHLFGALWTPERIVYFMDRRPVAQIATPNGFDKPMYMLLNLAVGGAMVGVADQDTPLPSSFDIDWVMAYAMEGHPPCAPNRAANEVNTCDAQ